MTFPSSTSIEYPKKAKIKKNERFIALHCLQNLMPIVQPTSVLTKASVWYEIRVI